MAKSKFEYVKKFEDDDKLLPNCWIVVRIDGHKFHRFSEDHGYEKPNDIRGLSLMNCCAKKVMKEFQDIVISYGESDEYSFVFKRTSSLYSRRSSKLMSNIATCFASNFVFHWKKFFPDQELKYPAIFDARTVLYPDIRNIKDYLSWRQADCHINNLYNTCFWMLVQKGGLTTTAAEAKLKGTLSADKNELLFSEYDVNYNNIDPMYRKGTSLIWTSYEEKVPKTVPGETAPSRDNVECVVVRERKQVSELYTDIIGDQFWIDYPDILI